MGSDNQQCIVLLTIKKSSSQITHTIYLCILVLYFRCVPKGSALKRECCSYFLTCSCTLKWTPQETIQLVTYYRCINVRYPLYFVNSQRRMKNHKEVYLG